MTAKKLMQKITPTIMKELYMTEKEFAKITKRFNKEYPKGMTDEAIKHFFKFEKDTIAQWLGYKDFKTFLHSDFNF